MTKRIITLAELKDNLHYNPETGLFTWIKPRSRINVGEIAGHLSQKGYIEIGINRIQHLAHRLAWLYVTGKMPDEQIDHIDMVKTNNKISNLRLAYDSINNQNMKLARKDNKSSKYLGVSKRKIYNDFRADIRANGKKMYLGTFKTDELAYQAYLEAKRRLHDGCTI